MTLPSDAVPPALYGRRWPTRELALEEADDQKAEYLRKGGVLIA
jgi:hypothetical protein